MESFPKEAATLHGVWIDVLNPLQADLNIDEKRLLSHLRNLSAKGFEKFVLFGYSGEGASFSNNEKLSTLKVILSAGVDASNICLGIYTSAIDDAASLIHQAYEKGVRRFLVSAPNFYQPLVNESITAYFEELLKRVGVSDWQLYIHQLGGSFDVPESSLAEMYRRYSKVFLGIVDQDAHVNHTMDLVRSFADKVVLIPVQEANLHMLKPSTTISLMANLIPNVIRHALESQYVSQVTKIPGMKVRQPDERITELEKIIEGVPRIAALKLLLSQHYRQAEWELVRPPQGKLGNEAKESLMKAFKSFNLAANE
jgi:4-hydroxy-tetrahydrodipicolinate synthase